MNVGVQFRGNLQANQTKRWFTFNWPASKQVVWTVVPVSVKSGAPEIEWSVGVERASTTMITYWITIKNLTAASIDIEARYAVMN